MDAGIASPAALIGDPTRAAMLNALMEGRALAAGELAQRAGVSAATASTHLARLLDGELVTVVKQGRHRYYQIAGPDVAAAIEALARIGTAPPPARGLRHVKDRDALRAARSCYDHLAGQVGVQLYGAMIANGTLVRSEVTTVPGPVEVGNDAALRGLGVDLERARAQRRVFARTCLDWTERTPHLAGALGAAVLSRLLELGWLRRPQRTGRGLIVTVAGVHGLAERFDCVISSSA